MDVFFYSSKVAAPTWPCKKCPGGAEALLSRDRRGGRAQLLVLLEPLPVLLWSELALELPEPPDVPDVLALPDALPSVAPSPDADWRFLRQVSNSFENFL